MNLFERGRRGIRICLALGLKYDAGISLHVKSIAAQVLGDPKEVKEICEKLVDIGYLVRDPAAAKSYMLAIDPEHILLGNIIQVCEEGLHLTDCSIAKSCPVKDWCFFDKRLWGGLQDRIYEMLNQITLQSFLDNMYTMSEVAPKNCHLSQLKDD